MVCKIFYNSKTANPDSSNVTNIREIGSGILMYQCNLLLFLIFRSIIRINFSIKGNRKQKILNYFLSVCQLLTSVGP